MSILPIILERTDKTVVIHDITSTEALDAAVALLGERLQAMKGTKATVLALSGDLGAGKTTLVQKLASTFGVSDTVTSPTFVIMKFYETTSAVFSQLIHMDAYRLDDSTELRPLGFTELLTEPDTLICIEWAERIKAALPTNVLPVTLTLNADQTRTLTLPS